MIISDTGSTFGVSVMEMWAENKKNIVPNVLYTVYIAEINSNIKIMNINSKTASYHQKKAFTNKIP